MKKLILLGGTMGVGKSAVGRALAGMLVPSFYLDGDWCWDMHPFVVDAENKAMVLDNITHLLRGALGNSHFQYVILSWVMHQQQIIDDILSRLPQEGYDVLSLSLVCTPVALEAHWRQDVARGQRQPDRLADAAARLPLYNTLDTTKIDVTGISPRQVAARIAALARR
nr:AAA family ATPase [Maliibacterium massiliense]